LGKLNLGHDNDPHESGFWVWLAWCGVGVGWDLALKFWSFRILVDLQYVVHHVKELVWSGRVLMFFFFQICF